MSQSAKKKGALRKGPAPSVRKKAKNQKLSHADRQADSEEIERAVYDGMQDLRTEKPTQ